MMLYKNSKVKIHRPDGDTDYFDIVAGAVLRDTLAPYLFIICLDYVPRTSIVSMKENGLMLAKKRSRRYPAQIITDAQAESLLHSLVRAASGIGLQVNADKTEYVYFNQRDDISTLKGGLLKLVDNFTYLESRVSSTDCLSTAVIAVDRQSVIWKSDQTDKIKRIFSKAAVVSILLYGSTTWMLTKRMEKKLDSNYTRMLSAVLNKSWRQHPTKQ